MPIMRRIHRKTYQWVHLLAFPRRRCQARLLKSLRCLAAPGASTDPQSDDRAGRAALDVDPGAAGVAGAANAAPDPLAAADAAGG